jgi:hypothetical protein
MYMVSAAKFAMTSLTMVTLQDVGFSFALRPNTFLHSFGKYQRQWRRNALGEDGTGYCITASASASAEAGFEAGADTGPDAGAESRAGPLARGQIQSH